jgi:RNA polymerase sigma factor (sigma-70 family)
LPDDLRFPSSPTDIDWPDNRLVSECLAGNEAAWTALVRKYKNLIYSIPIRQGFAPPDAGDIFQSVIAELLSNLGSLRESRALPSWLIQVTSHKCLRWKQQQQRECASPEQQSEMEFAVAEQASPEGLLQDAEREQILREALYRASPRCRELIHMLFYETPMRPYTDVATTLGTAVGSIGFIRRRCLDRLRKFLESAGFTST